MGLVFIAPIVIFFLQNNFGTKKIFFSLFSLPAFLLYLWLIKNIIVSGCAIYPVKTTCIKNLPWTNIKQIVTVNNESEAWSKGWPDRDNKNITVQEFSKNFNWLDAWKKKHLKYILNVVITYIVFLFFIILFIKIKFKNIKPENNKDINTNFFLCLVISGAGFLHFLFTKLHVTFIIICLFKTTLYMSPYHNKNQKQSF